MFTFIKHLYYKVWDRPTPQTFTYYIPAPPPRQTGYREKEFDQLFSEIIQQGYRIISVNTESHSGPDQSGMWVMIVAENTSGKTNWDSPLVGLDSRYNEHPIEGLYQVDD